MRLLSLTFLVSILFSCGTNPDKPYSDTPTSGKTKIAADETLVSLADAQLDTFHALYRYADINMKYLPEKELFRALILDSVKVIMASRRLNVQEEEVFRKRKLIPVTTKVAIDALAIIINNDNPDSLLTLSQLKKILSGEAGWGNEKPKKSFVFDENGSSTMRYLQDSILNGSPLASYCFAARSNEEVISYVEKNRYAMGVIGVSWISDNDDTAVHGFLKRIKVVAVSTSDKPQPGEYYKPYQAYIAGKEYPLTREVYMINREGRAGLGTGFVSFVAGDQGQRIIRLMGLLPATMPVRIIKTQ